MAHNLPYITSQAALKKTFEKIKEASTPEKFNEKYLTDKLQMKGGSARAIPPYLKRIGFIASDGSPTEWYKEFRNPSFSGQVAFKALKQAYKEIFEVNENIHRKGDAELKGIVAQITGLDHDNPIITYIIATFKTLKSFASFDEITTQIPTNAEKVEKAEEFREESKPTQVIPSQVGLNIGYNINLNLPATSDIAVFDAIFKSLKEHLLKA